MAFPSIRTLVGLAAGGVYVWRVQDPKASYAVFYDITDWTTQTLSRLFVTGDAATEFLRNALNLILVDQLEGFLIGIAVATLLSAVFWPFKAGARWCWAKIRRRRRRQQGKAEPANLEYGPPPDKRNTRW